MAARQSFFMPGSAVRVVSCTRHEYYWPSMTHRLVSARVMPPSVTLRRPGDEDSLEQSILTGY
jgi:hypothetical protein